MRPVDCPKCGAPLAPGARDVRVRCTHCGATTDVTREGVARLAATLERAGVRVAERPMTAHEIHAELAARDAVERAKRRRARILAAVFCVLVAVLLGALLLSSSAVR